MKYNVTVVGAGPAGSTAAKILSENGLKVVLIEKDKLPRDKPCGGGLPRRVLERFNYVDNERFIESYSYSGVAFSPSMKDKIKAEKKIPIIATALRKKFDFELVNLAKENGTIVKDGKTVTDLKIFKDKARILTKDGDYIDSEIVVGADGVWSTVAKKSGLRKSKYETGACVLQEVEVNEKILDEYFGKRRKCYIHSRFKGIMGYGWIFPKKEHLNIGIGGVWATHGEKINLLKSYRDYIDFLKQNNLIPKNLKKSPIKGGRLPINPLEKTYGERILLVGDAAGFINPSTGEGIYYAMSSGEIAAKMIIKALQKGDVSSAFLSNYEKLWKKDFGKDIEVINNLLSKESSQDFEELFRTIGSDKLLSELFLGVLTGELSANKYKGKIIRRYLACSIKNKLKKNKKKKVLATLDE